LFKYIRDRYNVAVYQNEANGKVRMQKREPVIKSKAYSDITAIAGPLDPVDNQSITGIRLKAEKDDSDKSALDDLVEIGNPQEEIITKISGLSVQTVLGDIMGVNGNVSVPVVTRPMSDKFSFRVFYYKGITTSTGSFYSFDYPRANINALNYDEKFSGATGLYEKLYKRWLGAQINRKSGTQFWTLPFREFADFDWEQKRRFDRIDFLVKAIEFYMQANEMSALKVELYTTT
jgi:hypothetical protein